MIRYIPYAALDPELYRVLNNFIASEFGHVPFVQQRSWATPDWTVVLEVAGEPATVCHEVVWEISVDGQSRRAAGLNHVITPAAHRGKGYSSRVLLETSKFLFESLQGLPW